MFDTGSLFYCEVKCNPQEQHQKCVQKQIYYKMLIAASN